MRGKLGQGRERPGGTAGDLGGTRQGLAFYLSIYLPTYLPTYLPIYLSIYLSMYLSIKIYISGKRGESSGELLAAPGELGRVLGKPCRAWGQLGETVRF